LTPVVVFSGLGFDHREGIAVSWNKVEGAVTFTDADKSLEAFLATVTDETSFRAEAFGKSWWVLCSGRASLIGKTWTLHVKEVSEHIPEWEVTTATPY